MLYFLLLQILIFEKQQLQSKLFKFLIFKNRQKSNTFGAQNRQNKYKLSNLAAMAIRGE